MSNAGLPSTKMCTHWSKASGGFQQGFIHVKHFSSEDRLRELGPFSVGKRGSDQDTVIPDGRV